MAIRKIVSRSITDGAVASADITNATIATADIADNAVTSAKLTYPLTTFSSTGIDDNADALALTIDNSENVLIGKTTTALATAGLTLGSSGFASLTRSGAEPLSLNRLSSDGSVAVFYKDGTQVGSIGGNSGDLYIAGTTHGLKFDSIDASTMYIRPINNSGSNVTGQIDLGQSGNVFRDAYVSGGVYFAPHSYPANYLDDYEEGTFTATLAGSSSNPNTACTDTGAYYTKIGRQVTVFINFINVDTTGASGVVTVTGLPFTSLASSGDAYVGGNVAWYNRFGINDGTDTVALSVGQNSTVIAFQVSDKNAIWTEMFHTAGSGAYFRCSTTYLTAA